MEEMHLDTLALGNARLRLSLADTLTTEFTADAGVRLALTCPARAAFRARDSSRATLNRGEGG